MYLSLQVIPYSMRFPRYLFGRIKPLYRYSDREAKVSQGEHAFAKWFKDKTGRRLVKPLRGDFDWVDPQSGIYYEVKDISYPSSQFHGELRLNKNALNNRLRERQREAYVVLTFSDGAMRIAPLQRVVDAGKIPLHDMYGNQPSLLVPMSTFDILS